MVSINSEPRMGLGIFPSIYGKETSNSVKLLWAMAYYFILYNIGMFVDGKVRYLLLQPKIKFIIYYLL